MKALAEGKSLVMSGHVSNVEYNGISNDVSFCYVRGKVAPRFRQRNGTRNCKQSKNVE